VRELQNGRGGTTKKREKNRQPAVGPEKPGGRQSRPKGAAWYWEPEPKRRGRKHRRKSWTGWHGVGVNKTKKDRPRVKGDRPVGNGNRKKAGGRAKGGRGGRGGKGG